MDFYKEKKFLYLVSESTGAAILSVVFLMASLHKIENPADFAKIIYNYEFIPSILVPWIALLLPWIEVNMAVGIIIPKARIAALSLGIVFLMIFSAMNTWNLTNGVKIPCGCFSNNEPATWWGISRNILLILIAFGVVQLRKRRQYCSVR